MKKKALSILVIACICALPLIYLAYIWDDLPAQVPLHYNIQLKPDRMGDKSGLGWMVGIIALVSLGISILMQNLHYIDPKRRNKPSSTFTKLSYILVIFLTAINFIIVYAAKGTVQTLNFLFPLLGLLFAFIGNYFNSLKPNYFAGYRLPWTLNSEENWKRTHRLAGKLWFWGGLLFVVISLLLPMQFLVPVFIAMIAVLVIIPAIFSYRYFKNNA